MRSEYVKLRMATKKAEANLWKWHGVIVSYRGKRMTLASLMKDTMVSFEEEIDDSILVKEWRSTDWKNTERCFTRRKLVHDGRLAHRMLAGWVHGELKEEDWQ